MQLDAFLRSTATYAPYDSMTSLVTWTNERHALSYEIADQENAYPNMWSDTVWGFEKFVRSFVAEHERAVFHTDDDVYFRAPPRWDHDIVMSLRLGVNTTYCHPLDCDQEPPAMIPWQWRDADGDFGYPLCLNATVYRSQDLLPLLEGWHFQNPTELEAGLAYRADLFQPEWMTAPLHSCCVSLPHNRVSSSSGCRTGSNPAWQPDSLLDLYLDGYRIDLDRMDFSNIVGAHQEVPLAFTRRQG